MVQSKLSLQDANSFFCLTGGCLTLMSFLNGLALFCPKSNVSFCDSCALFDALFPAFKSAKTFSEALFWVALGVGDAFFWNGLALT